MSYHILGQLTWQGKRRKDGRDFRFFGLVSPGGAGVGPMGSGWGRFYLERVWGGKRTANVPLARPFRQRTLTWPPPPRDTQRALVQAQGRVNVLRQILPPPPLPATALARAGVCTRAPQPGERVQGEATLLSVEQPVTS